MTTLKQQLEAIQEETEEIYWNTDSIIYTVKEWLTQKQTQKQDYIFLTNKFCKDHTKEIKIIQDMLIDELLEELNQP